MIKKTFYFALGLFIVGGILTLKCSSQNPNSITLDEFNTQNTSFTAAINPDKWYALINCYDTINNLWQALDVDDRQGVTNGTNVQVWAYHGRDNQKWKFVSNGNGYYRIVSKVNPNLALDADISPGPVQNGTNIHVWQYVGNDNQQWSITENGLGVAVIRSKANSTYVIDRDIASGSSPDGANVLLWQYWGGLNQKWLLVDWK